MTPVVGAFFRRLRLAARAGRVGHALACQPAGGRPRRALACQPLPQPSHSRHAAALAWAQAAAPALNCTPREMFEAFDAPPPSDPFVDAVRAFLGTAQKQDHMVKRRSCSLVTL